jgi:hypothetical protein
MDGAASWLMCHIKHFDIFNMGLLTWPRPLTADVQGGSYSIYTDSMVALSFSVASLTYQYSVENIEHFDILNV